MKQPGVFWFYWLGGKVFGSSELGVKLLELGWFLSFAVCLILCLRRTFIHPWARAGRWLRPAPRQCLSRRSAWRSRRRNRRLRRSLASGW